MQWEHTGVIGCGLSGIQVIGHQCSHQRDSLVFCAILKRKDSEPLGTIKKCVSLVCWHPFYHHEGSQPYEKSYSEKIDRWWHFQATVELSSSATWVERINVLCCLIYVGFPVLIIDSILSDSSEWTVEWKEFSRSSVQMCKKCEALGMAGELRGREK